MVASWRHHHSEQDGWRHLLWKDCHVAHALQQTNKKTKKKKEAVTANTSPTTSSSLKQEDGKGMETIENVSMNDEDWSPEQKKFKMKNKDAFSGATNYGEKSDILRYEILSQFGGIYVDCDFECLKPFDDLLSCAFFTGLSNTAVGVEVGGWGAHVFSLSLSHTHTHTHYILWCVCVPLSLLLIYIHIFVIAVFICYM
jgi:hypothetical protein